MAHYFTPVNNILCKYLHTKQGKKDILEREWKGQGPLNMKSRYRRE